MRKDFLLLLSSLILELGQAAVPLPATIPAAAPSEKPAAAASSTTVVSLPLVANTTSTCQTIPGESYATLPPVPPPTDRPAEEHADLNLALRSYDPTSAFLGLVDYNGGTDDKAPQLPGLFGDNRTPIFSAAYRVHQWDWNSNSRGPVITDWPVTLAGMAVTPGEIIHVPSSGYEVAPGYEVFVLYASTERITLKYTSEDNVVIGYTLHVEDVCVEPNLLALYQSANNGGRSVLPVLKPGQGFARATGAEIGVAIRDSGAFMDPRSRKDWWQGR